MNTYSTSPRRLLAIAGPLALVAVLGLGFVSSAVFGSDAVTAEAAMSTLTKHDLKCSSGLRTMSKSEMTTMARSTTDGAGSDEVVALIEDLPDSPISVIGCLRSGEFDPTAIIFAHKVDGTLMADMAFTDASNRADLADLGGLVDLGLPVFAGPTEG